MRRLLFVALAVALAQSVAICSATQIVYKNDFQDAVGPEWSKTAVDTAPEGGRKFLGQFGGETVRLSLKKLPAHARVTISFDLLITNSWDGNNVEWGPDIWELAVEGGPLLLRTTFSNVEGDSQAFPDPYLGVTHPARTGALGSGTLGYPFHGDAVYHVSYTILHSAPSVTFTFSSSSKEPIWNESWGLDNIEVAVSDAEAEARAHYFAGERAYNNSDYRTAIAEWELVLQLKPSSEHTKKMLVKARAKALAQGKPEPIRQWIATPTAVPAMVPASQQKGLIIEVQNVVQSIPVLIGRRSWWLDLKFTNQSNVPVSGLDVPRLHCDDYSSIMPFPYDGLDGLYPDILGPDEYRRITIPALGSKVVSFYGDDTTVNDGKKPVYVQYSTLRLPLPK